MNIGRNTMGYTHYFSHKATTDDKWAAILKDCKILAENMPAEITIAGGDGTGEPVFNDDEIVFNGAEDESHETFAISKSGAGYREWEDTTSLPFAFCKTVRKPYDVLVCACLLVYKCHSPETMELSSDGNAESWEEAENFIFEVLGYEKVFEEVRMK